MSMEKMACGIIYFDQYIIYMVSVTEEMIIYNNYVRLIEPLCKHIFHIVV